MNSLEEVFALDTDSPLHRTRTAGIHRLLGHTAGPLVGRSTVLAHALAHHFLEGAIAAAQTRDVEALTWYRSAPGNDYSALMVDTDIGPAVVVAPNANELRRSDISDTPYYLINTATTAAGQRQRDQVRQAYAVAATAGFSTLLAGAAPIVCLLHQRRFDETLHSWTISRLPGTVFTDYTYEPIVLARDLIHEAGHNWLNERLVAYDSAIPGGVSYYSPWRATERSAFGFLHACWSFPLTVLYAVEVLPHITGAVREFMVAYLDLQHQMLAAAVDDFRHAVEHVCHHDLRRRMIDVFEAAITTRHMGSFG
ncbi:MAG: HEXXH motif domain-containing protein [Actinobacteria bacterium]|nr:HEXXH motif domain-containing protein [Actinomycetota bacterium]